MARHQVELIARLEYGCHRNLLRGVSHFAGKHPDWELHVSPYELIDGETVSNSRVDAVIVHHDFDTLFRKTQPKPDMPVVYYGHHKTSPLYHNSVQVFPDENLVGAMAAQHFLERGFQSFLYCHNQRWPCSKERGESFRKEIAAHGLECAWLDVGSILRKNPVRAVDKVAGALTKLPRPLAILAINDIVAAFVLRAVKCAGFALPGDAALLGVDNDELLCGSQEPPLSSVDTNWHEMGYRAAEAIDRMIRGQSPTSALLPIAPKAVHTRTSTDFLAFPDRLMVEALCYIRENLHKGVTVQDVLRRVLVSRPTLDSRFRRYLGLTVTEEISRSRIERAQRMLERKDYTVERIAYECGYKYPDALFRIFRQKIGCTPAEYRERFRNSLNDN